jgi:hypothetical protein
LALIVSRVIRPKPKLATLAWWGDITLGADLGVAGASTDEVYAAMDWLLGNQDSIEAKLARRHLTDEVTNPHRMALFDLSSSWMEGRCCPLAARGYSRDGKKGKPQVEYGLLTDPAGRPVAVRVFKGNTADPTAFKAAVTAVRDTFGKAHILICMLAEYLTWHLRRALAPLTYTDEQPSTRAAARKASRRDEHDQPPHSFRGLLTHLATLTRNDIRYGDHDNAPVVPTLTVATPTQSRAF